MPLKTFPPPDLPLIRLREPAPQPVTAIPLKPSSDIRLNNPSFFPPLTQTLPRFNPKQIAPFITKFFTQFCPLKPIFWKFIPMLSNCADPLKLYKLLKIMPEYMDATD